ncbi:MFS transporter [Carnimonas bestiolae]|uniref:MFS transporter n=1 Tax=Carnimonas bestiolae TaxID=3402172 RepID=UPI003F4AEF9E
MSLPILEGLPIMSRRGSSSVAQASSSLFALTLVVAFVLFSLNLRGAITAIPPLVGQIHQALDINLVEAGLFTSIPIVCFGVLSPLASWVIARLGISTSILAMLVVVALGTLLRPFTGLTGMMVGTFVIGAALAMGNILGLLIIGRYFPTRTSLMTGVFTSSFNVGAMLAGALTVPIASWVGWQWALASWVWLPLITLAVWLVVLRWDKAAANSTASEPDVQAATSAEPTPALFRNTSAWVLSIAMAGHLFVYFSLTAWISNYMVDVEGVSEQTAGVIAGVYQASSVIGALLFPLLERRFALQKLLVAVGLLWFAVPLLMLVIPSAWEVWSVLGGTTNGMAFVTILMLAVNQSRSLDERRRLTAMVQGIGFAFASLGPIVLGFIKHQFGSWTFACLLLMAVALVVAAMGLIQCRFKQRGDAA